MDAFGNIGGFFSCMKGFSIVLAYIATQDYAVFYLNAKLYKQRPKNDEFSKIEAETSATPTDSWQQILTVMGKDFS